MNDILSVLNSAGNIKHIKASENIDGTYSLSTKSPVEALPITNIAKTIMSTGVVLTANTLNKFLAIKNNGTQSINLRLVTLNITPLDNKDIFIKPEIKNATDVAGTFNLYNDSTISEYCINPTYTTANIPTYPTVAINDLGISINLSERLNLYSGDVIVRVKPNEVLCFSALSKNATSFNFFIRHIEEF